MMLRNIPPISMNLFNLKELPPLEELVITVDPNVELVHTGTITGIVGCLGRS